MTVIRLENGDLLIHDPCKITLETQKEIRNLGPVKYIVAPGSYHHLFVTDFQSMFPNAETLICPGLERKRNDIPFHWILGNIPDPRWSEELDVVVIQGTKYIWEVPFFHIPSKTLILVDLLENIGDTYVHSTSSWLRFWWKYVYRMWNNPKAAPEYQMGWGNKERVRIGLERVLNWNAERVILSHGELIENNVRSTLAKAWAPVLND